MKSILASASGFRTGLLVWLAPGTLRTGTALLSSVSCMLSHCSQRLETGRCAVTDLTLSAASAPLREVDLGEAKVSWGSGETSSIVGWF